MIISLHLLCRSCWEFRNTRIKYLGVSFLDAKIGATHLGYIRAGVAVGRRHVSFPHGFQSLDNPEMFIPIFASVKDRNTWFFCISERFFHKICTSRYKKMSIKSWRSKILTWNKCSPNRVGARGINVPWEGVVLSLNLHEDMLDKFPWVNKSPEWDQPACERCHSRQLSETYPVWSSNTKKLEVCKETKSSNTCKKSHVIFTFTSWHKV